MQGEGEKAAEGEAAAAEEDAKEGADKVVSINRLTPISAVFSLVFFVVMTGG